MPDNDIVPRAIRSPWRKAYRAAVGGQDPADVADECQRALVKALRNQNLPPTSRLAQALRETAIFGSREAWEAERRRLIEVTGRSAISMSILDVGDNLLETKAQELGPASAADVQQELVGCGLRRFAEQELWGRGESLKQIMGESGKSPTEARQYQDACLEGVGFRTIAARLADSPSANVTVPRSATRRPTTAELLHEEV